MKTQTKELKEKAKGKILNGLVNANYSIASDDTLGEKDKEYMLRIVEREMRNLEKKFGYTQGSCYRW